MCRPLGAGAFVSQSVGPMVCITGLGVRCSADAWPRHAPAEPRARKPVTQTIGLTVWEKGPAAPASRRNFPLPADHDEAHVLLSRPRIFRQSSLAHLRRRSQRPPARAWRGTLAAAVQVSARSGHTWARRARVALGALHAEHKDATGGRERERERERARERARESAREREGERERESERATRGCCCFTRGLGPMAKEAVASPTPV